MNWPLVTRRTALRMQADARTETRSNLIWHLRQNNRGLIVLDGVRLNDITAPGPITVLGEGTTVSGSMFLTGISRVES